MKKVVAIRDVWTFRDSIRLRGDLVREDKMDRVVGQDEISEWRILAANSETSPDVALAVVNMLSSVAVEADQEVALEAVKALGNIAVFTDESDALKWDSVNANSKLVVAKAAVKVLTGVVFKASQTVALKAVDMLIDVSHGRGTLRGKLQFYAEDRLFFIWIREKDVPLKKKAKEALYEWVTYADFD
jgi:hypothetical protein